ncbi:MAG: hypothetical protein J0I19_15925 [Alphaproteobacteria bacterium]|nr:hypothetical protein [Alphaproteobacteria bacterium]
MPRKAKEEASTPESRKALLEKLWHAHASKLLEKITNTPASELDAATLNSAAKLLADNGVNADSLKHEDKNNGRALADEARELLGDPSTANSIATPLPTPSWVEEARSVLHHMEEKDAPGTKQRRA